MCFTSPYWTGGVQLWGLLWPSGPSSHKYSSTELGHPQASYPHSPQHHADHEVCAENRVRGIIQQLWRDSYSSKFRTLTKKRVITTCIYGPEFPNCQRIPPNGTRNASSLILLTETISSCCSHLRRHTNLLHWPSSPCIDPDKLVEHVQQAMLDYGRLAIALGGILKEKKCLIYLLDYKYMRRHAWMKLLSNLPAPRCYIAKDRKMLPSHLLIPQPEGPDFSIVTHDAHTASKILGVHFLQQETWQHMLTKWYREALTGLIAYGPSQYAGTTLGWASISNCFPWYCGDLLQCACRLRSLMQSFNRYMRRRSHFLVKIVRSNENGEGYLNSIRGWACQICLS